jgi:hypothetical protein
MAEIVVNDEFLFLRQNVEILSILSQKRGYLVEWKAEKTTKLKAHNIITNDEIEKKIKIKY